MPHPWNDDDLTPRQEAALGIFVIVVAGLGILACIVFPILTVTGVIGS